MSLKKYLPVQQPGLAGAGDHGPFAVHQDTVGSDRAHAQKPTAVLVVEEVVVVKEEKEKN